MKDKPVEKLSDSIDSKSKDVVVESSVSADSNKDQKKIDSTDDKKDLQKELNGPKGLEPTRYGDWESKGRCYDF